MTNDPTAQLLRAQRQDQRIVELEAALAEAKAALRGKRWGWIGGGAVAGVLGTVGGFLLVQAWPWGWPSADVWFGISLSAGVVSLIFCVRESATYADRIAEQERGLEREMRELERLRELAEQATRRSIIQTSSDTPPDFGKLAEELAERRRQ